MTPTQVRDRLAQGESVVVNLRDRELVEDLGDLVTRIDRRTRWGNPYRITARGRAGHGNRDEVIALYVKHIARRPDLIAYIDDLRGRALACWCAPEFCHGDVLVDLLRARDLAREWGSP